MSDLMRLIKCAEELQDIAGPAAKPCVVLLGSFNAGKSTLLNRLLGEEVSPVGVTPTTPCLLYFDYGSSFKARFTGLREKNVFYRPEQLRSFLLQLKSPGGRVDIEIPSPLLKKCRLVDTPGTGSTGGDSGRLAEEATAGADKVVYLFHQRGIEEHSRLFLYRLASIWKNRNLNDLSFWLNCNLGRCDGTSLEATREALRDIFLSQVRLNTINTSDQKNVESFRLFLEVELARNTLRHLSGYLKRLDDELPQRIKKAAGIKDESIFLAEFWGVRETAGLILETGRLLHSLPSVLKELDAHFHTMNSANLGAELTRPGGKLYLPQGSGGREIKKALLDLIFHLSAGELPGSFVDQERLKDLRRRIEEESFTIVAAGGFSTGKSTFFNALLKEEILPAADGPTTASVTRITYGRQKTATVHFPLQVTLQICGSTGGKASLCREEVAVLERWLTGPGPGIACLEACVDGRYKRVDRREMLSLLNLVKELFAAGFTKKIPAGSPIPSVFRLVPFTRLKGNKVLQKVRVTFHKSDRLEFDLANPAESKEFRQAAGPDNAFRIEFVEIQHPAGFLKLADFMDTPGLDWIQKHHYERTAGYIRQSDACLVFLNARQVLNDMDRENLQELLWLRPAGNFNSEIPGKDEAKYFFLINFADTLTPAQQETVYNFVRKNLTSPANPLAYTFSSPKIFLISALKGLAGDNGGMGFFFKSLENSISGYRARNFYLSKVDELYSILDCASRKVNGELIASGQTSFEEKKKLRRAQEILRESRGKLKDIRKAIYNSGR